MPALATPTSRRTQPAGRHPDDTPPSGDLRRLTSDDVDAAAAVLADAFDEDPCLRAVLPEPAWRRQILRLVAGSQVRSSLPFGHGFGVVRGGELIGLALWHPPGTTISSLEAALAAAREGVALLPRAAGRLPRLTWRIARDLRAAAGYVGPRQLVVLRMRRSPAWYLAVLAVSPAHQGRGVGRQLLTHVLDRCDADGTPAWLETTNPANPPFYERFGFEIADHRPGGRWLPGWWVMRREPRAR
jgi:GNAT superfamily N-acetyltransferase